MTTRPDPIVTIEAWLASEASDRAPKALLDETRERFRATRQRRGRLAGWRKRGTTGAGLAITAAAVVVVALLALDLGFPSWAVVGPPATPSPSPAITPLPSQRSTPTPSLASEGLISRGLPGPRGGRAGLYGWIPDHNGWMHNPGDGPGVEMFLTVLDPELRDHTDAPVFIDGHTAAYEEHPKADGGMTREWFLTIDGTRFGIRLESSAETIDADVVEAVAIVTSIKVEPDRNAAGFMLVLTVPDGWDSG